jgi:DNA-binding protein YbaB
MSDVSSDGDRAEEWFRSWSASVSERARAARTLSDEAARLRVSASTPDHTITITVNGSGAVEDLRLHADAARRGMDRLATEIMRTMRQAQAALAGRVAEIAAQTVGADSETGRAVVSSFERRFPEDDDEDRRPSDGR